MAASTAGAMRASGAAAGAEESRAPDAKPAAAADAFLSAVASAGPVPGGGSVAAYAGALAAGLTRMVTGLTLGKKKYAAFESEIADIASSAAMLMEKLEGLVASDAVVYSAVSAAYKMPKGTEAEVDARKQAITTALVVASLDDPSSGELLVREAMELVQRTETRTRAAMNLVEKALHWRERDDVLQAVPDCVTLVTWIRRSGISMPSSIGSSGPAPRSLE